MNSRQKRLRDHMLRLAIRKLNKPIRLRFTNKLRKKLMESLKKGVHGHVYVDALPTMTLVLSTELNARKEAP